MTRSKKSTIYNVAEEAGLSIATVSRVINQNGSFSKKTEEKVREAIQKLNYSPSASAQNLATQTTHTIGLVLNLHNKIEVSDDFILQFLNGVTIEATIHFYNILLDNNINLAAPTPYTANSRQNYDGLIFATSDGRYYDMIKKLMEGKLPLSYSGARLPFDKIGCNINGGYGSYKRDVLEFLYQKGFRNIVVFESYSQMKSAGRIDILSGVMQQFRAEKGLSEHQCRYILYSLQDMNLQYQLLMQALITSENIPEVIYTDNTTICTSAYNIINNAGLKIPEDISVISTSHSQRSGEEFSPPLTTICVNALEMGKRAAELLINQIEGTDTVIEHNVPYRIIERKSIR